MYLHLKLRMHSHNIYNTLHTVAHSHALENTHWAVLTYSSENAGWPVCRQMAQVGGPEQNDSRDQAKRECLKFPFVFVQGLNVGGMQGAETAI